MSRHEEKHQAARAKVKQNEQSRTPNQQSKQPGNRPPNQQGNVREESVARQRTNESARWPTESERGTYNRS
jgi:hypothetical protein